MKQALWGSIIIEKEYYIIALLLMAVTGFVCYYHKRDLVFSTAWAFLVGYMFLVFASTVITRTTGVDYKFNLRPFWSYTAVSKGKEYLVSLNIANVLMLIPVGFLIPFIGSVDYNKVVLTGVSFSGVIEFFQLILKRGLCEFDDIFHNTVGCVMGYLIYRVFECVRKRIG